MTTLTILAHNDYALYQCIPKLLHKRPRLQHLELGYYRRNDDMTKKIMEAMGKLPHHLDSLGLLHMDICGQPSGMLMRILEKYKCCGINEKDGIE